jgi:hypothetical protein
MLATMSRTEAGERRVLPPRNAVGKNRCSLVTCDYQLADKTKGSVELEHRLVLAADSVGFHLIAALFWQETATS